MESTTPKLLEPTVPTFARRVVVASTVLAWIAPLLFIGALALVAFPVDNPGVQRCGAPGLYLIRGTPDAALFTEAGEPIHGWDRAQIRRAYDRRCSVITAKRAVPAGILFIGFLGVGLLATLLLWRGRRSLQVAIASRSF